MICESNHYIPSCTSLCFEPITQFMVFSSLSTRYARVLIILMFNKERLVLIDQLAYSREKFKNKYDICLVITYFSFHLSQKFTNFTKTTITMYSPTDMAAIEGILL